MRGALCVTGGFVTIIFDLKSEPREWATYINEEIAAAFPSFFDQNPLVGSDEWWESSEFEITNGKISHAGPLLENGELVDVISIEILDNDYHSAGGYPEQLIDREDFWLHEAVAVDKLVETKSITIMPSGELDETSIYLETKVRVW